MSHEQPQLRVYRDEPDAPLPEVEVADPHAGELLLLALADRIAAVGGATEATWNALERHARPLLASIDPGMLVLADRGFYSRAFWDEAAATGAQLLWRVQSSLKLHVVTELMALT